MSQHDLKSADILHRESHTADEALERLSRRMMERDMQVLSSKRRAEIEAVFESLNAELAALPDIEPLILLDPEDPPS